MHLEYNMQKNLVSNDVHTYLNLKISSKNKLTSQTKVQRLASVMFQPLASKQSKKSQWI